MADWREIAATTSRGPVSGETGNDGSTDRHDPGNSASNPPAQEDRMIENDVRVTIT